MSKFNPRLLFIFKHLLLLVQLCLVIPEVSGNYSKKEGKVPFSSLAAPGAVSTETTTNSPASINSQDINYSLENYVQSSEHGNWRDDYSHEDPLSLEIKNGDAASAMSNFKKNSAGEQSYLLFGPEDVIQSPEISTQRPDLNSAGNAAQQMSSSNIQNALRNLQNQKAQLNLESKSEDLNVPSESQMSPKSDFFGNDPIDRVFMRHSTRQKIRVPVYTTVYSKHSVVPDRRSRGRRHPRRPPGRRGKRGRRPRKGQRPPPPQHHHKGEHPPYGHGHSHGHGHGPGHGPAFVSYGPVYGPPPMSHAPMQLNYQLNPHGTGTQNNIRYIPVVHQGPGPAGHGHHMMLPSTAMPPIQPYQPFDSQGPLPPGPPYGPQNGHPMGHAMGPQGPPQMDNYRSPQSLTISIEADSNQLNSQPLTPHGTPVHQPPPMGPQFPMGPLPGPMGPHGPIGPPGPQGFGPFPSPSNVDNRPYGGPNYGNPNSPPAYGTPGPGNSYLAPGPTQQSPQFVYGAGPTNTPQSFGAGPSNSQQSFGTNVQPYNSNNAPQSFGTNVQPYNSNNAPQSFGTNAQSYNSNNSPHRYGPVSQTYGPTKGQNNHGGPVTQMSYTTGNFQNYGSNNYGSSYGGNKLAPFGGNSVGATGYSGNNFGNNNFGTNLGGLSSLNPFGGANKFKSNNYGTSNAGFGNSNALNYGASSSSYGNPNGKTSYFSAAKGYQPGYGKPASSSFKYNPPMHFGHPMHNFGPPKSSYGQPSPIIGQPNIDPWAPPTGFKYYPGGQGYINNPPKKTNFDQNYKFENSGPTGSSANFYNSGKKTVEQFPKSASSYYNSGKSQSNFYNSPSKSKPQADFYTAPPKTSSSEFYTSPPKSNGNFYTPPPKSASDVFNILPKKNSDAAAETHSYGYQTSSPNSSSYDVSGTNDFSTAAPTVINKRIRKRKRYPGGPKNTYWAGEGQSNDGYWKEPWGSFEQKEPQIGSGGGSSGGSSGGGGGSGGRIKNYDDQSKLNVQQSQSAAFEDMDFVPGFKDFPMKKQSSTRSGNGNGRPAPNYDTNYNSPGMSKDQKVTDWMNYGEYTDQEKIKMGYPRRHRKKTTKYSTLPGSLDNFYPDPMHAKYPKLTYDTLAKRLLPENDGAQFVPAESKNVLLKTGSEFKKMLKDHDQMRLAA